MHVLEFIIAPNAVAAFTLKALKTGISLIMAEKTKTLTFLAPIIRGIKGTHEQVFEDLKKQGYTKIRADQKIYDSDSIKEELKLVRYEKHWIEAVIDTVPITDEERSRISEAVEQALSVGKGTMIIIDAQKVEGKRKRNSNGSEMKPRIVPSELAQTTPK